MVPAYALSGPCGAFHASAATLETACPELGGRPWLQCRWRACGWLVAERQAIASRQWCFSQDWSASMEGNASCDRSNGIAVRINVADRRGTTRSPFSATSAPLANGTVGQCRRRTSKVVSCLSAIQSFSKIARDLTSCDLQAWTGRSPSTTTPLADQSGTTRRAWSEKRASDAHR